MAIKIEDGGPVLYPQRRWGKDKKSVNVYKFRTMVVDADKKFGPVQAQENDPRITRVGGLPCPTRPPGVGVLRPRVSVKRKG